MSEHEHSTGQSGYVTGEKERDEHGELRELIEERTRAIEAQMQARKRTVWFVWGCVGLVAALVVLWWSNDAPPAAPSSQDGVATRASSEAGGPGGGKLPPLPGTSLPTSLQVQGRWLVPIAAPLVAPLRIRAATLAEDIRLHELKFERQGVPPRLPQRVEEFLKSQQP